MPNYGLRRVRSSRPASCASPASSSRWPSSPTSRRAPPQLEISCRTLGKPRQLKLKLFGGQLVAVDENLTARVERHRPSPRRANYTITDIHCLPRHVAEVLDHRAADLAVCPRIHTHPHVHRHPAVAGIVSRPASAFQPS